MCQTCRQHNLDPEFEAVLHGEEEVLTSEWSGFSKTFSSPFFNWLSGSVKKSPTSSVRQSTEKQTVIAMISSSQRNENTLTDTIFYKRHPELGGKPLSPSQPGFSSLGKEWIDIRDNIVRYYLRTLSSPPAATPSPSYGGRGKITLQNILNAMAKKRYIVYQEPYRLNIVGVRVSNPIPDSFDDSINVFYKDAGGNWQFNSFVGTTDPGAKYLNTPINPNGTAIVKPGQYINSHKIGLHRGEYTALVQQGKLTVIRDTNKDSTLDFNSGKEETGYFGINIHRATDNGISKTVGGWSAGCQVFASSSDFARFIDLCKQHSAKYGNNFSYTLIPYGDL